MSNVEDPNENDVLLGRGSGANQWVGNKRFRDIVKERKVEYNSTRKNELKKKIADDVYQCVSSRGGRFLHQAESANPVECDVVVESTWQECPLDVALEKCRQALRQHCKKKLNAATADRKTRRSSFKSDDATPHQSKEKLSNTSRLGTTVVEGPLSGIDSNWNLEEEGLSHVEATGSAPFTSDDAGPSIGAVHHGESMAVLPSTNLIPALPPSLGGYVAPQAAIDPRLSLYHTAPLASHPYYHYNRVDESSRYASITPQLHFQTSLMPRGIQPENAFCGTSIHSTAHLKSTELGTSYPIQDQISSHANGQEKHDASSLNVDTSLKDVSQVKEEVYDAGMKGNNNVPGSYSGGTMVQGQGPDFPPVGTDEDVSEFLLSILTLSAREKFTEEQSRLEKANMTDNERARVLSDLFGKYCSTHENKKCRKDLKMDDVAFLVKQMRMELERIPSDKKAAMIKAQKECAAEEFSDARLERFLRCEGMDFELGARRFVYYWECRRQVFGDEKYLMRMTLSEALCDDRLALETGMFSLLPRRDLSGRPIIYMDPSRHTREAYTSESLLRVIWYVVELASRENNDSSFVQLVWLKYTSIFDYDVKIYDRMYHFDENAWPIRPCSFHVCCPQSYTLRIVQPVLFAVAGKENRARTMVHTVPEKEILSALAEYGIDGSMVPKHMGGALEFDHKLWIKCRRATEMEEL